MSDSLAAQFVGVTKDYSLGLLGIGKRRALTDASLAIPTGSVFALLGPNRAGKTTLIKLLLTLCYPTAGQITRLGKPVDDRSTLARVGYVHENHAFPKYLTPARLLHYYGAMTYMPQETIQARVEPLLTQVGLIDRQHDPIRTFSKGMVQRLGFAQALLNDPDLLVLDEPNEGLDLLGRQLIRDVVLGLKARGKTVILVSHVLPEVEQLCDRVAIVVEGRIAFAGTLHELQNPGKSPPRNLEQAAAEYYRGQTP